MNAHSPARQRKFRQAAMVYLHVGVLYEALVWNLARSGDLPARGPVWAYLLLGALIVAAVVWGLWSRQSVWLARIVWGLHLLRAPWLMRHAFQPDPAPPATLPETFYLVALIVVLGNAWMLARAGWDL